MPNNHLASGIQYENIRGLVTEPPVEGLGSEAPHETGGLGGWSPPSKKCLNSLSPEYTTKVKYNIDHNSKTKKSQQKKNSIFCAFRTMRIFWDIFLAEWLNLNDHISKLKIGKIDFSFVSEHCATFWTKKK